jgi:hypothetical protein
VTQRIYVSQKNAVLLTICTHLFRSSSSSSSSSIGGGGGCDCVRDVFDSPKIIRSSDMVSLDIP